MMEKKVVTPPALELNILMKQAYDCKVTATQIRMLFSVIARECKTEEAGVVELRAMDMEKQLLDLCLSIERLGASNGDAVVAASQEGS